MLKIGIMGLGKIAVKMVQTAQAENSSMLAE